MNQICQQCGKPKKFVPGGVSKRTGKKYESFSICETCKPKRQYQGSAQADNDQGKEILALLKENKLLLEDNKKELKELHDRLTQAGIWQQGEFDTLADLIKKK